MTNKLLNFLYPPRCYVCDRVLPYRISGVCSMCDRLGLPERVKEPVCKWCGKPVGDERMEYCYDCQKQTHAFTEGRAVFAYRGMEDAMHRFKNDNRRCYADCFALEMAELLKEHGRVWRPDIIVPIPIHPKKQRRRGYNQAELLSGKLSELTGIREIHGILIRKKYTQEQKQLDDKGRRKNLKDAFRIKNPEMFVNKRVLLTDDIYTTGSTLDAAAECLKEAGAQEVYYITVCIGKGY